MSPEKSSPTSNHEKARVTLADIAKRAGVSKSAASVVLHSPKKSTIRVGKAKAEEIKALAKELGYIPNQAARQLSLQRSKMWGVFCDAEPSELNALRLAILHKAARDKGYRLIVEYYDRNRPDLDSLMEVFHNLGVEGVICLQHYYPNQHTLIPRQLTEHFKRVVFIEHPEIAESCFCGMDYIKMGKLVYQTLRQHGPHPGLLLKNLLWYAGPIIAKGFTEAWKADHPEGEYPPIWLAEASGEAEVPFDITTAQRARDSWILPNQLTGVAVWNDERATLVLNALQESGLQVPQDIAVLGIGNARICNLVRPMLSSIDLQVEHMINASVEMLFQLCQDEQPPSTEYWVEPLLQLRQSCPAQGNDGRG
ncbi:MAG: LacI family DNA-binding transcriptional regulator [Verrucomicrobiota bacterium]